MIESTLKSFYKALKKWSAIKYICDDVNCTPQYAYNQLRLFNALKLLEVKENPNRTKSKVYRLKEDVSYEYFIDKYKACEL